MLKPQALVFSYYFSASKLCSFWVAISKNTVVPTKISFEILIQIHNKEKKAHDKAMKEARSKSKAKPPRMRR